MGALGRINRAWVLIVIAALLSSLGIGLAVAASRHASAHLVLAQEAPPPLSSEGARIDAAFGRLPLQFEANVGQADDGVEFLSRGRGYTLSLTRSKALLSLRVPADARANAGESGRNPSTLLGWRLVGGNPGAMVEGLEELPGKSHYFIGNDPTAWRTNVPTYGKVGYQNVYPGIDLVYYGNQSSLEYDFVVAPGADL